MAETEHSHEFEGHRYGHDHEGGDEPHKHEHTMDEADDHDEAVAEDGTCPVCGDVHELDDEEEKEEEDGEDAAGDDEVSDEGDDKGDDEPDEEEPEEKSTEEKEEKAEEPTKVSVPPQAEEPEGTHERKHITTSAFRRRRQH